MKIRFKVKPDLDPKTQLPKCEFFIFIFIENKEYLGFGYKSSL